MGTIRFKIYDAFIAFAGGNTYAQRLEAKKTIANKMNIPRRRLSQIINGNLNTAEFREIAQLADILNVEITALYENIK